MRLIRFKAIFLIVVAILIAATTCALFLISVEVERFNSPNGKYVVIGYQRLFWQFIPAMPGQGSDAPRDVEIVSLKNESMGKVKVPIGGLMYQIVWTASGAEIITVAEWDFEKETAYYWSADDTQIWTKKNK